MLAKRIIPSIKRGRAVKGARLVNLRKAGDPVVLAAFYNREGAPPEKPCWEMPSHGGRYPPGVMGPALYSCR